MDEVETTMRSKEFSTVKYLNIDEVGEGLCVSRGGSGRGEISKYMRFDQPRLECFIFQKKFIISRRYLSQEEG